MKYKTTSKEVQLCNLVIVSVFLYMVLHYSVNKLAIVVFDVLMN